MNAQKDKASAKRRVSKFRLRKTERQSLGDNWIERERGCESIKEEKKKRQSMRSDFKFPISE